MGKNPLTNMKIDYKSIREYCLQNSGATAGYPFGEGVLVIKALDKMFALVFEDSDPLRMNLKCDPEDAQALRTQYPAIIPGYHMNKEHWNTLILDGSLPADLVFELIDHSYDLVVRGMKKKDRDKLI
jgi:predicted DNA-binding protein (MmcQ/YjbR family)